MCIMVYNTVPDPTTMTSKSTVNGKSFKYLSFNHNILGGSAVIIGTRIPISRVLFLLKEGYTPELISSDSGVEKKKLNGAIDEAINNIDKFMYGSPLY